jgi:phage-related protein
MMANPIGVVIAAIALLVAAFVTLWKKCDGFRNFFLKMWESIKKIGASVAEFIGGVFEGVINTVKGIINGVISLINGAIGAINKIKVNIPDWVPGFGGKTFGFNLAKIPKLAEGGIAARQTAAIVGDAGKEAILPLERNTQWMDKLAEKINARGSAPSVVNVTNRFERMETTRLALHKANLETKRLLKGGLV